MRYTSLVLCLWASFSLAQDAPDSIPKEKRAEIVVAVKKGVAFRGASPDQIAAAKAKLTAAQAGKIDPKAPGVVIADGGKRFEFPSKEARSKYVANQQAELAKLEAASTAPVLDPLVHSPPLMSFNVGDFGRFSGTQRVVKVTGRTSALVTCTLPVAATGMPTKAKLDFPTATVYLDGLDTSALADRMGATVPGIWYVAGNRQVEGRTYLRAIRFQPTAEELAEVTPKR